MATTLQIRDSVALSVRSAPIVGVVRTASRDEAAVQARTLAACGVELVEITFTVPGASGLVRELLAGRPAEGPPWFGMGTVTTAARAREAVAAVELGADLVKVYPLPPVGGPAYLSVIRGPLGDVPMLAAGGFGVEEIPAYHRVGAVAFGLAAPLLGVGPAGSDEAEARRRIARALQLAQGAASI